MIITASISFSPVHVKTGDVGPLINKVVIQFTRAKVLTHPHAMGINVQGEASTIFSVLRDSINAMHKNGVDRIVTNVQIDSQATAPTPLNGKLATVQLSESSASP